MGKLMIFPRIKSVAIVGADSQIGQVLLPRFAAKGISTYRIGRGSKVVEGQVTYVFDEQRGCFTPPIGAVDAIISLAPLPSVDSVIKMAQILKANRIVAFGSTGRFSKVRSTSEIEREFVALQQAAEEKLFSLSEALGIGWTLLRPTMIYGADADQNVAFIQAMIRRFGIFPMPIGANGLRQPVHVHDLAVACISVLETEKTRNRAYNLGGGEVLEFRELVRRIFLAEEKRPILIPIPMMLYSILISIAKRLPKTAFVRNEMVERMFKNLTVDNRPAFDDFSYTPNAFSLPIKSQRH